MIHPLDPAGAPSPRHRQGHPSLPPGGPTPGPDAARGRGTSLRPTRGSALLGVVGLVLIGATSLAALPAPEPGDPAGLALTTPAPSQASDPTPSVAGTPAPTPSRSTTTTAPRSPVLGRVPMARAVPTPVRDVATPTAVRAPAQDLTLPVDAMGVDAEGAVAIPDVPGRISWYRYGPAPGQPSGSAVFAGHVDGPDGKTPLYRIKDLLPGDVVDVVLATGRVLPYRVRAVDTVAKARLGATDLFRRDGSPVLRLVTCGGPWLADRQDYRDNVVVTAEPVR